MLPVNGVIVVNDVVTTMPNTKLTLHLTKYLHN